MRLSQKQPKAPVNTELLQLDRPSPDIVAAGQAAMRGGKLSVTDGPFAETKEQLAGFYLLDARDLNEAIQMAAKIPPAREGSVEVRPVRELNP